MSSQDLVFVRGLEFEANHGYTAAERRATRRFRCDITLGTGLADAAASDRLGDTIDYRQICEIALRVGTQSTYKLLEALAGAMADAILAHYPGCSVRIEVEKLAPPCPGIPHSCGVVLHRGPARPSAGAAT